MDNLVRAAESLTPVASGSTSNPNWLTTNDDQHFLLLFIFGTFFGPDIKTEQPKKSVLQRIAEGLPPYTSDLLARSQMKTIEVKGVYYYVLKNADQSLVVKLPLLHQFFQGNLYISKQDPSANHRQFPDLFPSHLHPQSWFKNQYKIIENIVFINNPDISYIKPEYVERFKRLTGLEDLLLNRNARLFLETGVGGHVDDDLALQESESSEELHVRSTRSSTKRQRENDKVEPEDDLPTVLDVKPFNSLPYVGTPATYSTEEVMSTRERSEPVERVGPAMLFLPSHPTTAEWNDIVAAAKSGIALTGSVAEREAGPVIGLVDIGACEDAYLFRVSLPGVRKDEREFSCEVETDGQVLIKGITTTGDKVVQKNSQVFEMQSQNLCPSGNFSVSFQLPGPVEPREFSGNFGADAILEVIVMKQRSRRQ